MNELKRLKPWLRGSETTVFFAFVFATLATICKLAIPFLAGLLINYYDFEAKNVCRAEDGCMDETGLIAVLLFFLIFLALVLNISSSTRKPISVRKSSPR